MLWFVFIICVAITNLFKVSNWMRKQPPDAHPSFAWAIWDFLSGDGTAQISTLGTIFAEMAIGATVIDEVPFKISFIPKHWAWVGLIACASEGLAPILVKFLVSKYKAVFPGDG